MDKTSIKKNGFTVVEALVSIAILLLSITGAFTVAQSSLQSSIYAKSRVTAYYLAQEGVEFMRNYRDNNGLNALKNRTEEISWLNGLENCLITDELSYAVCYIDIPPLKDDPEYVPELCSNGACAPIFFDDTPVDADPPGAGGLFQYSYSGQLDAQYSRDIWLTKSTTNDNEVLVTVRVTWNQGSVPKEVIVKDRILNWQDPNI
jgi:type II secretory pathway pseudopilin PulG